MIEIKQLTKQFGDLRAVDDISLTVPGGEFFVILGQIGRASGRERV